MKLHRNKTRNFQIYFNDQHYNDVTKLIADIKSEFKGKKISTDIPLEKHIDDIEKLASGESKSFRGYMLIYSTEYKAFDITVVKFDSGYALLNKEVEHNIDVYYNPESKRITETKYEPDNFDVMHESNAYYLLKRRLYNILDMFSDDDNERQYLKWNQFREIIGDDFEGGFKKKYSDKHTFINTYELAFKKGNYKGKPHNFNIHYHTCPNDIVYIVNIEFEEQPLWEVESFVRL